MTPAELIQPVDPELQVEMGGTHSVVEDFRADFPATDAEGGNNTIVAELRQALPVGPAARLELDGEHSALYAYGAPEDLQVMLNTLQGMKAAGFGQLVEHEPAEPKLRLTIGQRAAKDRLQDLLAAMVVQGHDPDDIRVGLQALGYG